LSIFHEIVWTLPFFLYAETHYRFKYFLSFLRKAEPELIADAPHRIDPGSTIPLLVIAKDADKFPVSLSNVKVIMRQSGETIRETHLVVEAIPLHEHLCWKVFELPRDGISGWIELDVFLTLKTLGSERTYQADNHRTSSHAPLKIFLSDEPLPRLPGLYFGDAHTHSDRTEDQVEFGSPINPSAILAKAMGLSFFCVADHSYDLDDAVGDYSKNDPELPKWKSLLAEIGKHNSEKSNFVVIQGEEISCRNIHDENVHFLLLGDEHFFHGSGDGAERWFQTRCENSITDVLDQKHQSALGFAAHPMEAVSVLQRWLLGRGSWTIKDLTDKRLTGIQFANGTKTKGFILGYNAWIRSLLAGSHLYCLAGNDAHGNFNRFRQIGVPFLTIREADTQLFGKMRTGVYLDGAPDYSPILQTLALGRFVITDGPVVNLKVSGDQNPTTSIGKRIVAAEIEITLDASSTSEFGELCEIKILLGVIGERSERVFFFERATGVFTFRRSFSVRMEEPFYIRAEAYSSNQNMSDKRQHFCFTNPIWCSPEPRP